VEDLRDDCTISREEAMEVRERGRREEGGRGVRGPGGAGAMSRNTGLLDERSTASSLGGSAANCF